MCVFGDVLFESVVLRRVPSAPSECIDIATSPVDSSDPNAMEKATPHSYTPCRCRCVGSQQTSSSLLSLPSASCVDASSARLVSSSPRYLSLSFYGLRWSTIWYHGTRSTNKGSTQKEYKDIEKTQVASHEMRGWGARRGDLCLTPPRVPSPLLLCESSSVPSCPPGSHSAHRHHDLHARSG